jgi:uncharacterized protein with HEPN domain
MSLKSHKYLIDILNAILLIEDFLIETETFFEYQNDLKTKSAVERQLVIVGEAINTYGKIDNNKPIIHAKEIINFRNRLVHAYDNIDDSIVWAIKTNHLPLLKFEINQILIK